MPPPWTEKAVSGGFRINDAEGKALACVFGLDPCALPAAGHQRLTTDEDVQRFLQVNRYQGILWFNKEAFEELMDWMIGIAVINTIANADFEYSQQINQIADRFQVIRKLKKAESQSDYQVEKLLEAAR